MSTKTKISKDKRMSKEIWNLVQDVKIGIYVVGILTFLGVEICKLFGVL